MLVVELALAAAEQDLLGQDLVIVPQIFLFPELCGLFGRLLLLEACG